jgi:UDP-N-acetylglucosamine--dolichyl-phosphate N-acetylglucosaminephosphotransferase
MEYILLLSFVISFIVAFLVTPHWIKRARKAGLVGIDVHKYDKKKIAEIGGIPVVIGFIFGVLSYIAIKTFYLGANGVISPIFAVLSTVLIIALVGLIDDILGWKIGLRQWQKPFLTLIAALPIMVINAGQSTMIFPLIGEVNLGFFYPLFIVPLAIVGASNGFNMLAGYNGLEAGMGAIILSALGFIAWQQNLGFVAVIALCMVFALLAFLIFNRYPARIFPGDTLTYSVGAVIACVAILGNVEKAAVILFIPYFIEFFLKLRGFMQKESFARVNYDNTLELRYNKVYGLEHFMILLINKIKRKVYERDVVYSLYIFELILVGVVLI